MQNPTDVFIKVFTIVGVLLDFPDLSWSYV